MRLCGTHCSTIPNTNNERVQMVGVYLEKKVSHLVVIVATFLDIFKCVTAVGATVDLSVLVWAKCEPYELMGVCGESRTSNVLFRISTRQHIRVLCSRLAIKNNRLQLFPSNFTLELSQHLVALVSCCQLPVGGHLTGLAVAWDGEESLGFGFGVFFVFVLCFFFKGRGRGVVVVQGK